MQGDLKGNTLVRCVETSRIDPLDSDENSDVLIVAESK